MLDRKLIEKMYETASQSNLSGAKAAAKIYEKMLKMPPGATMTVQFEAGEDFLVTCVEGGYKLS